MMKLPGEIQLSSFAKLLLMRMKTNK